MVVPKLCFTGLTFVKSVKKMVVRGFPENHLHQPTFQEVGRWLLREFVLVTAVAGYAGRQLVFGIGSQKRSECLGGLPPIFLFVTKFLIKDHIKNRPAVVASRLYFLGSGEHEHVLLSVQFEEVLLLGRRLLFHGTLVCFSSLLFEVLQEKVVYVQDP